MVMSQSHKIKGHTTDEAFQDQCFLWERGALVRTLDFLTPKIFHMQDIHKALYISLKMLRWEIVSGIFLYFLNIL